MNKENTKEIFKNYQRNERDTGSMPVQIALLTKRIYDLTDHLKINTKDFSCKRTLLKLVARRRKYLRYLKQEDFAQFESVTSKLSLKA